MDGRGAALRLLKVAAAAGDHLRPRRRGVVVLIYHRVGGGARSEIDLPAAEFERQMAWLAESGRVIGVDDAVDVLDAPEAADPSDLSLVPALNPVVVTFDDGTADLAEVALPILVRYEVPATVYLATRHIDEQIPWPAGGVPLSWTGAQEMVASGMITVGSHTHSHALMDRLSPDDAADELGRSKQLIEDKLGVAAQHFAYPKAVAPTSPEVEALVRDRFRSATLAGNRPNVYGHTDLHRLSRTPIQVSDGQRFFRHKAVGGMALEDTVRRAVNNRRYRDL
ncbi:MAG: polysaccharide deacetylase family protein [Acidimicrobiales bacterium]